MIQDKFVGKKVLLSLDNWFSGPTGDEYKIIWGTLLSISKVDDLIGFSPNRPNVNWIFEIGDMIIYGCQVKTILLCPDKPNTDGATGWTASSEHGLKTYQRPNIIYITK